jgi:hypothetical protein
MLPWRASLSNNKNSNESKMMDRAVMNLGVGCGSGGGCHLDDGGGGGAFVLFWPGSQEERSVDFSSD